MPSWNQTLRIRGAKLGESDTYIDAVVDDYAMSGHVRLIEDTDDSPREWSVVASQLNEWNESGHLAEKGTLANPSHDIWTLIAQLESHVGDETLRPVESELAEIVDDLYAKTTQAQRQQGSGSSGNRGQ